MYKHTYNEHKCVLVYRDGYLSKKYSTFHRTTEHNNAEVTVNLPAIGH